MRYLTVSVSTQMSKQAAIDTHDALIALGCRELGIELIVTFDEDFERIPWLTRIVKPEMP